ncbi:MAG: DUF4040 domain-containing protein [Cyanobacteria bacterium J06623_7]
MIDKYIYVIVALLPIASLILVFQSNPYQALIIRAILGAVAALVYATLGGSDVALTEALVGTMLGTTLYVVSVRSSLIMRVGVIEGTEIEPENYFGEFIIRLKKAIAPHHLRLEIVDYADRTSLKQALADKEVHAICTEQKLESVGEADETSRSDINLTVRVHRLFEILQQELVSSLANLEYAVVSSLEEKH